MVLINKKYKSPVILILAILFICSCADKYVNQQKITGTWEDLEGHKWFFNGDGKLIYENSKIDYREYEYNIDGDILSYILPETAPDILQKYKIYFSNKGKTLKLKGGVIVPRWTIAGPGWSENKLIKISDENNFEQDIQTNIEISEDRDSILLDDLSYKDKYGNLFNQYDKRRKISCTLFYAPDTELLLQLKNRLVTLTINNKSLNDVSFLKVLPQLKELYISESNILSLEPVKYLDNLEVLTIAGGYPRIIDCAIFKDFKNLKKLDLTNNKIENIGAIYKLYNKLEYQTHIHLEGIKGYEEYREKYSSLWGSESYVFHYDKYHVFQHGVKVRAKPSENSDIIAELSLHDEIQIMENTEKEEKINEVWGYWYKIKHNNVTGYVFGGYIAAETLITDIDKNEKKDYFYLRYASSEMDIEPDKDIIIYINDKKIDTSVLSTTERSFDKPFEGCIFEEGDGDVLIGLKQYGRHDYEYMHIFKVFPTGKIEYVKNWDEIDYW